MKKVIMILGPTAVGKSKVGIEIAKKFNGEIISADSVQVYKDLNIGSAKITDEEMEGISHYGLNLLNPEEEFSVYEYVNYTKEKIEEICSRNKIPIIVGGTGLYVKALTLGYNFGGVKKDEQLRNDIEKLIDEKGVDFVYQEIYKKNPKILEKIDKNNIKRLVRAYEIVNSEGVQTTSQFDCDYKLFALNMNREILYDRINKRVEIMVNNGLIEEVESLLKRGLTKENQSMKAIGYKEVIEYLNSECDYDYMLDKIKQHTRNYAKRQLTFIRGLNDVNYIDMQDFDSAIRNIEGVIDSWI